MISDISYSAEWIQSVQKTYKGSDPTIVESVIRALSLLEHLVLNGLEFTFKGGTAVMLLFGEPKRFSVDIDIITQVSKEDIEAILIKICLNGTFVKWELDERRSYKEGVPKAHYKLYYESSITKAERNILLDLLFEKEHGYPIIIESNIELPILSIEDPITKVKSPDINSILGDKLTAFAPNTVGVPYTKP